jgi:hypothetical protein
VLPGKDDKGKNRKKKLVDKNLLHVHDIYTKAEIGVGIDLLRSGSRTTWPVFLEKATSGTTCIFVCSTYDRNRISLYDPHTGYMQQAVHIILLGTVHLKHCDLPT